jgi:cbb3-type cytochrome c oxidase subunit III
MKRIAQMFVVLAIISLFFIIERGGAHPVGPGILNASSSAAARDAATIYKSKCATCHGKDGSGKTLKAKFNSARNLADANWQQSVTDERIFNSISNGRGKKMPAFGNKLSETEIESLVTYIRRLKK